MARQLLEHAVQNVQNVLEAMYPRVIQVCVTLEVFQCALRTPLAPDSPDLPAVTRQLRPEDEQRLESLRVSEHGEHTSQFATTAPTIKRYLSMIGVRREKQLARTLALATPRIASTKFNKDILPSHYDFLSKFEVNLTALHVCPTFAQRFY